MKIAKDPGGIYQEYLNDIDYKTAMGFVSKWPELTNFIEGKQWPAPTEETKYLPRPVINVCDQTVENKRSNILSQQLKMQFRLRELPEDENDAMNDVAQDFSDMAENTWYNVDQDTLTEEMVNDAICIGNGILFYYFDNDYVGGTKKKYKGKIDGELIDPMDIVYGNNRLKSYQVQKQPFIIIVRSRDADEVRKQAKKNGEGWELIEPDTNADPDEKYTSAKVESKNSNEVKTFTKFWKENGEVYWCEVTKTSTAQKPRPLAPQIEGQPNEKFTLYPIVHTVLKRKRKCVYGRSLIEDIIPNQKALNWGMGMQLLSVQQTAWPKIIAKVGALTQQITNVPGEVLEDNYQGGADGFKYMQMPNTPNTVPALMQTILDMTRNVVGVSEVSTGESIGANMAASAIIALQNQAQKPNDGYMQIVVQSIQAIGEIWEQFYKCFYTIDRTIKGKDEDGNPVPKVFNGEKGRGIEFDLIVDVGPSSMFSESLQVSTLDSYADRQWIDKYQHSKYMPTSVLPQGLREELDKEQELIKQQAEEQAMNPQDIMGQMTPEEQRYLMENPQLMEGL